MLTSSGETKENNSWTAGVDVCLCFNVLCRWTRSCQIWETSHSSYRASGMGWCPEASWRELPKRAAHSQKPSFLLNRISVETASSLLFIPENIPDVEEKTCQTVVKNGIRDNGAVQSTVEVWAHRHLNKWDILIPLQVPSASRSIRL